MLGDAYKNARNRPQIELLGAFGQALSPLLEFLDPTADARACVSGDEEACTWVEIGMLPFGKLGRMVDDMGGGGGGVHHYIPAPQTVPGIPSMTPAKAKTPVKKGGALRSDGKNPVVASMSGILSAVKEKVEP